MLGQPAVAASIGGSNGGGAALTEAGRSLVAEYRAMERAAHKATERRLTKLLRRTSSG